MELDGIQETRTHEFPGIFSTTSVFLPPFVPPLPFCVSLSLSLWVPQPSSLRLSSSLCPHLVGVQSVVRRWGHPNKPFIYNLFIYNLFTLLVYRGLSFGGTMDRARPRSASFKTWFLPMRRLEHLMSRCMMPWSWRYLQWCIYRVYRVYIGCLEVFRGVCMVYIQV